MGGPGLGIFLSGFVWGAIRDLESLSTEALARWGPVRGLGEFFLRRGACGWAVVASAPCLRGEGARGEKGGTNRSDIGLNLSGSWQQGHSATYNTPSRT